MSARGRLAAARLFVRHAERGAAPARRHDVRVVHLEAGAHQRLGVVDRGAVDVAQALLVDEDADPVEVEDLVAVVALVERELILEARAAAALDRDAQPRLGLLLRGEELADLLRGDVGKSDHLTPDSSYVPGRYRFYSNAERGATERTYRGRNSWIDSIGRGLDRHGRPLPRRGGLRALRRAVANRAAPARLLDLRRRDRGADPRPLDQDIDTREQGMTNEEIRNFLQQAIDENEVMLFMKGTPEQPACGFSMRTSGALNELGVRYAALDILPDPRIRQELSALSSWPTIPQLFVKGELVGGADIVTEMYETGELHQALGVEAPEAGPAGPAGADPSTQPLGIENNLR